MITLIMNSDVANRFLQGKENIATAVIFGRVKLKGPMTKILELAPVTRPIRLIISVKSIPRCFPLASWRVLLKHGQL